MNNIHFLGDSVVSRFLMVGNVIERGGHPIRVDTRPIIGLFDGRVYFNGTDLENGQSSIPVNLHPEVFVRLGTDI